LSDEEIMRKLDKLIKDPEKLEDYLASRMDRVVKNWGKKR